LNRYFEVLGQLERSDSNNPLVQGALGTRDVQTGKYPEAVEHLRRAIADGPPKTILYTNLADALLKLDRPEEAAEALQQASDRDPFNAKLRKRLIVQLIQIKDYANAKKELEDYVQRFPADWFMRQMLDRAPGIGQPQ
jgi:predicted Zn-dependent protease